MLKKIGAILLCLMMLPLFACADSVSSVEIELTNDVIYLTEGESQEIGISEFTVDGANADKSLISFKVADEKIATVTNGSVTGVAEGDTVVTVSYLNKTEKVFVSVLTDEEAQNKTILELSDKKVDMRVGEDYDVNVSKFTLNNQNLDKSLLVYESDNEKVATVTDGKITAVGLGDAVIKVSYGGTYKELIVSVDSYPEIASMNAVENMTTDAVKIHGRCLRENGKLIFDNVNSGLELWFYGTECKVNFDVAETTGIYNGVVQYSYLRVFIDDQIKEGYQVDVEELNVSGKRIALTSLGENVTYTLASGLKEGFHRIQILKASEQRLNGDTRWVVTALNSDANCQILKTKTENKLKIDFYGDSITCGAGALGEQAKGDYITNDNGDGTKTYAAFTARALNADCSVVSKSGLSVSAELTGKDLSLKKCWDNYSIHNSTKYQIDSETDLVVINLGTNDTNAVSQGKTDYATLTTDIVNVLTEMKQKYTKAKFVWCYGMMNEIPATKNAINDAITQMGGEEAGFYYLTLTVDTTGGATHPTVNGHIASARKLVNFIEEKNLAPNTKTGALSEKKINVSSDFGVAGKVSKDFGIFEYSHVTKDENGNPDWGLIPAASWGAYVPAGTGYITYKIQADEGYTLKDLELNFDAVYGHCGVGEYYGNTNLKIYTSTDNATWKCVYDMFRIKHDNIGSWVTYNDCVFDCSETTDGQNVIYIKFELVQPSFSALSSEHQAMEDVANSENQTIVLGYVGIRLHKVLITGKQIKN